MEDRLVKLVRTYRVTSGLADRTRLAEEIFRTVEPDLRLCVIAAVRPSVADDVLQEVLKAIITSLESFQGQKDKQFWAWCHRITRNKIGDQYRAQKNERLQAMPSEEVLETIAGATQVFPLSTGERLDLEYAMNLLVGSKPECRELLWKHFVLGLDYAEIAEQKDVNYDAARMKVGRCLEEVRKLVA